MTFDMNRTWSQAISLMRANLQLLAVISGIFLLLPTLAFYFAIPDVFSMMALGEDPEEAAERMVDLIPQILGFGVVALLLQLVGYMAMIALIGDARPTVGEAIARGIKSLPTVVGTLVLFMAGYLLFSLLVGLVIGLMVAVFGGTSGVVAALSWVVNLAMLVFMFYVFARLSLTLPVVVLERELNPWKALRRSWRLTAPRAWAILGFFSLLFVAYMVIAILLMTLASAFGFAAGETMGGASLVVISLLYGLMGMVAAMLLSAILVSMHGQLAGQPGTAKGD